MTMRVGCGCCALAGNRWIRVRGCAFGLCNCGHGGRGLHLRLGRDIVEVEICPHAAVVRKCVGGSRSSNGCKRGTRGPTTCTRAFSTACAIAGIRALSLRVI